MILVDTAVHAKRERAHAILAEHGLPTMGPQVRLLPGGESGRVISVGVAGFVVFTDWANLTRMWADKGKTWEAAS